MTWEYAVLAFVAVAIILPAIGLFCLATAWAVYRRFGRRRVAVPSVSTAVQGDSASEALLDAAFDALDREGRREAFRRIAGRMKASQADEAEYRFGGLAPKAPGPSS